MANRRPRDVGIFRSSESRRRNRRRDDDSYSSTNSPCRSRPDDPTARVVDADADADAKVAVAEQANATIVISNDVVLGYRKWCDLILSVAAFCLLIIIDYMQADRSFAVNLGKRLMNMVR
jgi:hypothetical protein